ncbi:PilV family protein [Humisphaera borealis]|uniref:Type II secretion system protein n=1 Tax=Humisphaera borealis TaxID=2807512 RepID=A0A7M2WX92_9BACT|nr:hypothetical protein [Humisphaera borealis]QOV90115.1 hypothetical protein IPV69_01710 [Humisphaera borealis]
MRIITVQSRRKGFTLIEAAWVTVIVGIGAVAMLELLAAGTVVNANGNQMTTAVNLANNMREIALGLPFNDPEQPVTWATKEASVASYDDVLDLDGTSFSPPLDVRRQPIADLTSWKQTVTVQSVAPDAVPSVRPNNATTATARVTVKILQNNKQVHEMSWLVVAPNPG